MTITPRMRLGVAIADDPAAVRHPGEPDYGRQLPAIPFDA